VPLSRCLREWDSGTVSETQSVSKPCERERRAKKNCWDTSRLALTVYFPCEVVRAGRMLDSEAGSETRTLAPGSATSAHSVPSDGGLTVEYRPASALIPFAKNARTHSDAQVAQIAASIREFGFTNPILVDGENGIIAGHGRLLAARKLGMETVP